MLFVGSSVVVPHFLSVLAYITFHTVVRNANDTFVTAIILTVILYWEIKHFRAVQFQGKIVDFVSFHISPLS